MNNNTNLTTKPLTAMTREEKEILRNQLIDSDIKELNNAMYELQQSHTILENKQNILEEEVSTLQANSNVLGAPVHSHRKKSFKKLCLRRVYELFENKKDTSKFVLFSPFLFKKIYADVANNFGLGSWLDLSMKDFEDCNSLYEKAKEYVEQWFPSKYYIKDCLKVLQARRDNGVLKPERCRALTKYLAETNNGEINPFYI